MIGKLVATDGEEIRGTDYMARVVSSFFDDLTNLHKYNWIIIPSMVESLETYEGYKNIIWMHVPTYQLPEKFHKFFQDPKIVENTAAYIVQSEFHKRDIIDGFDIDPDKIFILNNTFTPIEFSKKSRDTINFIYTPAANRGLDILIDAFTQIKDENIRLKIHGCSCETCIHFIPGSVYEDSRVSFVGYTSKDEYIRNVQDAHILAYPARFQETAGIALMEALSAGVYIISTDLGAIPETTMGFAKIIKDFPYLQENQDLLKDKYTKIFVREMKKAIKKARYGLLKTKKQSVAINNRFNIDVIKKQWEDFNSLM